MNQLDKTDLQLLDILQDNSNLTTKELAAKVNLTPTPVFERIKKLEKEGYIKKYAAILNEERLGNGFIVFCNVRLKQHTKEFGKQFMEVILSLDEVTECYNTSGEYDFMIKVQVRSMKHYQDFVLNKLGEVDCIGNLHSIFVLGNIKQSYKIPLEGIL